MTRIFQNDLFGSGLGFAVNVKRIGRVCLKVIPIAPVKNQIRGKENEPNFRRQFREPFCDFNVYPPCQCGIRLRLSDDGEGSAMNDELWFVILEFAADGIKIEQVKLGACQCPHAPVRGESQRGPEEIISDESVRAGYPSQFSLLFVHTTKCYGYR
jgi:hypothetical protein